MLDEETGLQKESKRHKPLTMYHVHVAAPSFNRSSPTLVDSRIDLTEIFTLAKFGSEISRMIFSRSTGGKTHFAFRKHMAHKTLLCPTALACDNYR